MPENVLNFQYQAEKKDAKLTRFAGLPLFIELAVKSGLTQGMETLKTKKYGWSDAEVLLSLIILNLVGGDSITDIDALEEDSGLRTLLMELDTHGMRRQQKRAYMKRWRKKKERAVPSHGAIHRYLSVFHSPKENKKRVAGKAFIPTPNEALKKLMALNRILIDYKQANEPSTVATLDQDATLTKTYKYSAYFSYKKFKAYQPFNTYWSEQGMLLHSEFRDGNVNAGYEQLRILKEALALLPLSVVDVFLRSDSAGYQEELLRYCAEGLNERLGVIHFAIASKVCKEIRDEAKQLKPEEWKTLYYEDLKGIKTTTTQEYAEIIHIPDWAMKSQVKYRYYVIREAMKFSKSTKESELPFQTIESHGQSYKLFAMVTNLDWEGNKIIQWHRERCGKSEHVHSTQKSDLAGGKMPSGKFGVNAAWWQIMVLAFNLNRLMQTLVFPKQFKESRLKAIRFHLLELPGYVIYHARQWFLRVKEKHFLLYEEIRQKMRALPYVALNSS